MCMKMVSGKIPICVEINFLMFYVDNSTKVDLLWITKKKPNRPTFKLLYFINIEDGAFSPVYIHECYVLNGNWKRKKNRNSSVCNQHRFEWLNLCCFRKIHQNEWFFSLFFRTIWVVSVDFIIQYSCVTYQPIWIALDFNYIPVAITSSVENESS